MIVCSRSSIGLWLSGRKHVMARAPSVEMTKYIEAHCAGKSVLHVGCACFPNTLKRIETGRLLHLNVEKVANAVVGIDISKESVDIMLNSGFKNIFCIDAKDLIKHDDRLEDGYDVVLLAAVIEHIEDPAVVLSGAKARVSRDGEIIVSVPNVFYWYGFLLAMVGRETTHPEHVATYQPMNLHELMRRVGLKIVEMRNYHEGEETKRSDNVLVAAVKFIERSFILKLFPWLSCGIILRAQRVS